MPESERLDDADLRELERRLLATTLSPTSARRDQLLFACGRQAGLSEARQQVRRWAVTAATLGIVAGAVAVLAVGDRSPPSEVSVDSGRESRDVISHPGEPLVLSEMQPSASERNPRVYLKTSAEPQQLTAGMDMAQALALLDARPTAVDASDNLSRDPSYRPLRMLMKEMP